MSRLARLGGLLQEGSLYGLLFLLPFSKAAVEIAFGVLLCGWLLERIAAGRRVPSVWTSPPYRPLLIGIGLYLAACALSIPASTHPAASLRALISKWLEYLLFLVIVADTVQQPRVARRGLTVLLASSVLVVLESVAQEFWGKGLIRGYPLLTYERMTGPYENPIDLATYLMVVIVVLLGMLRSARGGLRWALGVLLTLLIGCFARTEALGAWIGLAAGLAAVVALDPSWRRAAALALGSVALAAAAALVWVGRLGSVVAWDEIGKVDRWDMWQAALGMIRDRPILGHGLNTFMANYLAYWVGGEQQPRYAHNCYLQVAAETGVIGLAAFLMLLGALFGALVRGASRLAPNDRPVGVGLIGALVAFAVQAALDTNFYSLRQAALFWALAGLSLGLLQRREASWRS